MSNRYSTVTGLFKDIANAIRDRTGSKKNITAKDFPEAIDEITIFSEDEVLEQRLNGSLSVINFSSASFIGSCAFTDCNNITSASFPLATRINERAFQNCFDLSSISFPVVSSIASSAFYSCHKLTSAYFPMCNYIGDHAFFYCDRMASASFPSASYIGSYAFYGCATLSRIYLPRVISIGSWAFCACKNISEAKLPSCSFIGDRAFYGCESLSVVNLPACRTSGYNELEYTFEDCHNLKEATLGCDNIGDGAFSNCYNLSKLVLTGSKVCYFGHYTGNDPIGGYYNVLCSTPFTGYSSYFSGTPCIYVPSSLLASYRAYARGYDKYFSIVAI